MYETIAKIFDCRQNEESMTRLLSYLIYAEWACAWFTQLAFWHISPPIRDRWVWLLLLPLAFGAARWFITRRLSVPPALTAITLTFLALSAFNFEAAPLRRQDYWVLVCRPLAGMWLVAATVQLVQWEGRLRWPLAALSALALAGVGLGMFATQWDGKSAALDPILRVLPRLDHRAFLPDAQLSFNPNEIAGALALLCPLMLGLAYWRRGEQRAAWTLVGLGLLAALLLGQSRFALVGVGVSLGLGALLLLRGAALRWSMAALAALLMVEVLIISDVPGRPNAEPLALPLAERDIASVERRFDMIGRSLQMLRDHPLTGVGMSMYRTAIRQPAYQIPAFEAQNFTAPHAHNLWAQMAADLGLPGLLWYGALHLWIVWMLVRLWRADQRLACALGGAFLAYGLYGLGDAITLWDRLGFVWWALIALAASGVQVSNMRYNTSVTRSSSEWCASFDVTGSHDN
jgi:O-antigen ligase